MADWGLELKFDRLGNPLTTTKPIRSLFHSHASGCWVSFGPSPLFLNSFISHHSQFFRKLLEMPFQREAQWAGFTHLTWVGSEFPYVHWLNCKESYNRKKNSARSYSGCQPWPRHKAVWATFEKPSEKTRRRKKILFCSRSFGELLRLWPIHLQKQRHRCREQMYGHQTGKAAGGVEVVGWIGRLGLTYIHQYV